MAVCEDGYILEIKSKTLTMKKIRTKDIDPKKLITKSEYARAQKVSPVTVQRMIERGDLTIVKAQGAEIIHL